MTIKIGDQDYRTSRPKDLSDKLAAYGLSEAEVGHQLRGDPSPDLIARAIKPFLPADAPSVPELASAIAADKAAAQEGVAKAYKDEIAADEAEDGTDGGE